MLQKIYKLIFLFLTVGILSSCNHKLSYGNYSISLEENDNGFSVKIYDGHTLLASQGKAAIIDVKTPSDDTHASLQYAAAYKSVRKRGDKLIATANITTDAGSVFIIKDKYSCIDGMAIEVVRDVTVKKSNPQDLGYASRFSLDFALGDGDVASYHYFIPSILYKNTEQTRPSAVGADLSGERMYVKETRTGLPLAMLRDAESGNYITLAHFKPQISVGTVAGGGKAGEVNDQLEYGSIGYSLSPDISVDFCYPSLEGPRNYEPRDTRSRTQSELWYGRYHSITEGGSHSYRLSIIAGKSDSYADAMTECFSKAYTMEDPALVDIDMSEIYQHNIDIFMAEYQKFGTGDVIAAGLPWSLDLPDGKNTEGVSFQMGFVGQQIAVGYHLYRYGKDNGDEKAVQMGSSMVDFWTSDTIMSTYFPTVWWDPANDKTAGRRRNYPSFLRCFVDGMEGLLDACRISEAYGDRRENWEKALDKVASNLVARQNEDGSFYRAYNTSGEVETGGDRNTLGTSKLNTPVAVRFLVKMYEHSGDKKYKTAAIRAAEFSYNELYKKLEKYVGGTPDNPNTVDKEAAIFALYAFNAAHDLTGEEKYLKAAEHAAVSVMTWAYCYDFAIPHMNDADKLKNPFSQGGTLGFSIIATGHSGADNFIAYVFYEMFKLYIKTGNDLYLDMANFLEYNTKLNTDYDGRMNYKYKAFMPEATNIADLAFRSVSLWLPWSSIANIEPIVYLEEAFGTKELNEINDDIETLRKKLKAYGTGGKDLSRNH